MIETIINVLSGMKEGIYALAFAMGFLLCYFTMVKAERKRYDEVYKHVEELFELQKAALERISNGTTNK